jgi:hypothetical protein
MITEIDKTYRLYRCDTELPPTKWDTKHALQTNYGKKFGEKGPKNQAGFFFFYDDITISNSYGSNRLNEINKDVDEENLQKYFYITETQIKEPIKIIDFSLCHSMFMMIDLLMKNGFDILTSEFTNHQNNRTFDDFLVHYNAYLDSNDSLHALKIQLTNHGHEFDYSFMGQVLSDFENGIALKRILQEHKIDGYRWREHNDPRGLTYCLLSSEKLQDPKTSKIELEN